MNDLLENKHVSIDIMAVKEKIKHSNFLIYPQQTWGIIGATVAVWISMLWISDYPQGTEPFFYELHMIGSIYVISAFYFALRPPRFSDTRKKRVFQVVYWLPITIMMLAVWTHPDVCTIRIAGPC